MMSMLDIVLSTRDRANNSLEKLFLDCWKPLSFSTLSFSIGAIALCSMLSSCARQSAPQPRTITLKQQWVLNPGDEISGSLVSGSLGDISLVLKKGTQIKAPFEGFVEPSELEGCDFYSTPEIPAYLFRLCGLSQVAYGEVNAGRPLGKASHISFATLRKQPDGTWIIVEPARGVLEKAITK